MLWCSITFVSSETIDNLEEIFENREQIEVSSYYERLPKAGAIAIQELENEIIVWKSTENEDSNE